MGFGLYQDLFSWRLVLSNTWEERGRTSQLPGSVLPSCLRLTCSLIVVCVGGAPPLWASVMVQLIAQRQGIIILSGGGIWDPPLGTRFVFEEDNKGGKDHSGEFTVVVGPTAALNGYGYGGHTHLIYSPISISNDP